MSSKTMMACSVVVCITAVVCTGKATPAEGVEFAVVMFLMALFFGALDD